MKTEVGLLKKRLLDMGACREAAEWAGDKTLDQAWAECERGDWMLWLAHMAGVETRLIVLSACDCAETASGYYTPDTVLACVWAIDSARRFVAGETDREEVVVARSAASDAAYAAYAASAAAYAAYAAAASAAAYTDASDAAAYAAYAAADAHAGSLRVSADLVRARISYSVINAAMGAK
jgi:hypothetical protein